MFNLIGWERIRVSCFQRAGGGRTNGQADVFLDQSSMSRNERHEVYEPEPLSRYWR